MSQPSLLDTLLLNPHSATGIQALQRTAPHRVSTTVPHHKTAIGNGKLHVRCPRCHWQPRQQDRWSCTCGHVWNTFDTGGVCPECKITWQQTQCLRCQQWSRHDDWYVWEEGQGKV